MSKFYTLNANSDVVTADDVVPSGTGTEVIATIGGKQIKAPAGGGGGTVVKVANVGPDENGNVPLTAEDVGALPKSGGEVGDQGNAAGTLTLAAAYDEAPKIDLKQAFTKAGAIIVPNSALYDNTGSGPRASILKGGEEVATEAQLRVTMQLVGNDPYTVQLGGVVQTFDQVKALASTRNAVIQRGQGTYRPTYIGENEMMWDVIGTVQGAVLTGQIHMWKDGDVVQRVEPKTLATEPMVDAVSTKVDEIGESVSVNNRILVADTTAAIQTRADEESDWADEVRIDKGYDAVQGTEMVKLDKSVQTVTVNGGTLEVVFPDAVDGTVRDLCLYVNNTSSESTVEMTFPDGTYYGADGWDAAAQKGGITGYYFSEIPGNGWRVSREELNQFVKGA